MRLERLPRPLAPIVVLTTVFALVGPAFGQAGAKGAAPRASKPRPSREPDRLALPFLLDLG
jgi:hypothetical protein